MQELRERDTEKQTGSALRAQPKGSGIGTALQKLTKGVDFRKVGEQAKIASQIFTSPKDLLKRFELLGGSIMAGNNNPSLEKEFVCIAHKLRDLGILNNTELLRMLKNLTYVY